MSSNSGAKRIDGVMVVYFYPERIKTADRAAERKTMQKIDTDEIAYTAEKLGSILFVLRMSLDNSEGNIDKEQIKNTLCLAEDLASAIAQAAE